MSTSRLAHYLLNSKTAAEFPVERESLCFGVSQLAMRAHLRNKHTQFDQQLKQLKDLQTVPPFFKNLSILCRPDRFRHLLGFTTKPSQLGGAALFFSNPSLIECDLDPESPDDPNDPIKEVVRFSGAYTFDELRTYFATLRETVLNSKVRLNHPVTLTLGSTAHYITVAYDPNANIWMLTDIYNDIDLPTVMFRSIENITRAVHHAFFESPDTVLLTTVHATRTEYLKMKQITDAWLAHPLIAPLHQPTYIIPETANRQNKFNISRLFAAVTANDDETVRALLRNKANPNLARTRDGNTPLHSAAWEGSATITRELLQAGANPNVANMEGVYPLHFAVQAGHIDVVRELLKTADLNVRTKDNETPLHLAVYAGYSDIVALLSAHGADTYLTNNRGLTPLYLAEREGQERCAELLSQANFLANYCARDEIVTHTNRVLTRSVSESQASVAQTGMFSVARVNPRAPTRNNDGCRRCEIM